MAYHHSIGTAAVCDRGGYESGVSTAGLQSEEILKEAKALLLLKDRAPEDIDEKAGRALSCL
jgi:hypothetical protein